MVFAAKRKTRGGTALKWLTRSASPRFRFENPGYISLERVLVKELGADLANAGLTNSGTTDD